MELLKMIKEEWAVIAMAPFSFLILAALMFGAAYFIARWRYTAIVEQVKESNAALTERLHLRSEQTESYRDKASKYDQKLAEVVDSGAPELKDKALKLVGDIREFVGRHQRLDQSLQNAEWVERCNADPEQDTGRLWNRYASSMINNTYERNGEYERRFKIDALMLRDELRSRLPDYKTEIREDSYEHPTNYFGFNDVANDLERMAKSL